jgi:uncharacterized damage-inducible protein DinB
VDRPAADLVAAEREVVTGYLTWHRTTFLRKCTGLTGEQLAERSVPPSALSLLGLIRHLAGVERVWFRLRFAGEDTRGPGREADFTDLDAARARQEYEELVEGMRRSEEIVAKASLDDTFVHDGQTYSLRLICFHVMQEYARHGGHADLIRERVDGTTGY